MTTQPTGPSLTPVKVRELTAHDLGIEPTLASPPAPNNADPFRTIDALPEDDPILVDVEELLKRYGGVIFTGPPGTGKSYYAERVAVQLANRKPELVRFLQFHPSYQYEDFVQGFVPKKDGTGFVLSPKHLLQMCKVARDHPDEYAIIVIDELSRADPGRVFGELLTYVERSKRELLFFLASGDEVSIPENLVFIATMNPLDRGVDEVDSAFDRRFAKIRMDPQPAMVSVFLQESGMEAGLRARVERFFNEVTRLASDNPFLQIGHTYFENIRNERDLQQLWTHQLSFHFEKALSLDPDRLSQIRGLWNQLSEI